jgi:hypothetical protein
VALASRALDFSDEENLSITASCDDVARAVRRAENVVTGHSRQDRASRPPHSLISGSAEALTLVCPVSAVFRYDYRTKIGVHGIGCRFLRLSESLQRQDDWAMLGAVYVIK